MPARHAKSHKKFIIRVNQCPSACLIHLIVVVLDESEELLSHQIFCSGYQAPRASGGGYMKHRNYLKAAA